MNVSKRITAVVLAFATLILLPSCGLATRSSYDNSETSTELSKDIPELTVAVKTNTVGVSTNEENSTNILPNEMNALGVNTAEPKTVVSLVFTGDIRIDDAIVADAAKQAESNDAKDYSFLRMYSGVYRTINDATIAVGSYSAAAYPIGSRTGMPTPDESLVALDDMGYDVLDISGADMETSTVENEEIKGVSARTNGDDAMVTMEKEGITFGFLACGGENFAQSYSDEKFLGNVEYADLTTDIVAVMIHWDSEMSSDEKTKIAETIVEAGADILVGDGETVSTLEWYEREDGTKALIAYSLGNLLLNAEEGYRLVSGMLTLNVSRQGDVLELSDTTMIPTFVQYTKQQTDYTVYRLSEVTAEMIADHPANVSCDGLYDFVKERIPAEFLPEFFQS